MKSEHRHELKTNELAEWLVNFPNWAKENLKMIIYISVVVVVVAGVYIWKTYQTDVVSVKNQQQFTNLINQLPQIESQVIRAQSQGIDYSYMLIQLANELGNFARNTKDKDMAIFALIKKAKALRTELHYRMGKIDEQNFLNQINQAKAAYNEAAAKAQGNPSLEAFAAFGTGLCEEELGNFEQAKQIYQQIIENPEFKAVPAVESAKRRLDIMDAYKQRVAFKEAPKPEPEETIQPQFTFEEPDINMTEQTPAVTDFNLSVTE